MAEELNPAKKSKLTHEVPMNVIEKILCHHAIGLKQPFVKVGDIVCVKADWTMASEITFVGMDTMFNAIGRPKVHRPDRFWLALDHTVDPRVNDLPKQKGLIKLASDFAKENELTEFWEPNTTIMHTEFAKKRAQPGQIVIGADSHTCSAGGMGAFAAGLGAGDVVMPVVTGQTWFKIPEVVYIEFVGEPTFGIGGKDVILHILGELKRNTVAFERAVYFGGEGIKHLSDDGRFAIANMTTEFGGIAGVCQADEITQRVLNERDSHNKEGLFFRPDPGCNYAAHHVIDLSKIRPLIALYPSPDNCVPVTDKIGMKLDGCFIGACTTTEEDLILGALLLKAAMDSGKTPVPQGRRRVTPGSLRIVDRLKKLGLIKIYEDAGFDVGVPSCSFCVGIGADVAGEGEVWLSSQNRNFRNRMGKGSIGNLATAACVAASSFDMQVTDPTPFIEKIDKKEFDTLRRWYLGEEVEAQSKNFEIVEPSPEILDGSAGQAIAEEAANVASFESTLPSKFSGKVQRFGDNIDTDAVIPAQFMGLNKSSPLWPPECETEEQVLAKKAFGYVKPEFYDKVQEGFNIVVAGIAFGSGSSREEAARCLVYAGVKAVIAKSFAYIYSRNQPNNALLGIIIKDEKFYEYAQEGAEVTIDVTNRLVKAGDLTFPFTLSQFEENFLRGGGLKNLYKRYKNDLFRASLQNTGPKPVAAGACGGSCGTAEEEISW